MSTKVVMEALSPTMEEGRLVEWKKQEGDTVAVGDVLAEVETDKAVMELVARSAGTLLKHVVAAGATVPVSQTVAVIGEPGEAVADGAEPAAGSAPAAGQAPAASAPPAEKQGTQPAPGRNRPESMPPAPPATAADESRGAPARPGADQLGPAPAA
ncbi:MAG TPA: biotin/lipoyl-containing protein, partial [Gemmatimonadales bacterium]|nr:biotin/lipoyl-containing protein [Gemmatimonadales bacterium]